MPISALTPSLTQPIPVVRPQAAAAAPAGSQPPHAVARTEKAGASASVAEAVRATPKLTPEQEARVRELQRLDAKVRAHEQAHAAVGGQYAGAPSYETTRGPDGRVYATGGHVSIDLSPVPGDPAATMQKMEVVKRAALAPAEPSAQDRSVAQKAERLRLEAQRELRAQEAAERHAAMQEPQQAPAAGLMREAAGLYEKIAQAFRPSAPSRTLAIA